MRAMKAEYFLPESPRADSSAVAVTAGPRGAQRRLLRPLRRASAAAWVGAILVLGYLVSRLPEWSYLASLLVSRTVAGMSFRVEPGNNPSIRFPRFGPYDQRLGYTALPAFIGRLAARNFEIESQARASSMHTRLGCSPPSPRVA
jgi:hypothetical protein